MAFQIRNLYFLCVLCAFALLREENTSNFSKFRIAPLKYHVAELLTFGYD